MLIVPLVSRILFVNANDANGSLFATFAYIKEFRSKFILFALRRAGIKNIES